MEARAVPARACPAGQALRFHNEDRHGRRKRYRAKPSVYNACDLKARCTTSERDRVLYRPFKEDYYDRVRAYCGTFAYENAIRKRQAWVEPLFAEAKDWHGMRRFRLRGLEKVNIEALLIASGQNAKRLLAFGGRGGPKKPARAAALLPPVKRSAAPGSSTALGALLVVIEGIFGQVATFDTPPVPLLSFRFSHEAETQQKKHDHRGAGGRSSRGAHAILPLQYGHVKL